MKKPARINSLRARNRLSISCPETFPARRQTTAENASGIKRRCKKTGSRVLAIFAKSTNFVHSYNALSRSRADFRTAQDLPRSGGSFRKSPALFHIIN